MSSRKHPGHAGGRLRGWLVRWLGVGKAQRLKAETRAEALVTAYRHKLLAELHNLKIMDVVKPFDPSTLRLGSGQAWLRASFAQDRPFDLETSYVPLRLRPSVPLRTSSGQALQVREYNGRGEFTGHVRESKAVERKARPWPERGQRAMSPQEALVRFRHLTVLGDPGAGKTTMLRYLALLAAQGRLENLPDFPILVPLGQFAAVPQVNLLDFVISEIEACHGFPGPRPDGSKGSPQRLVEGPALSPACPESSRRVEGLRPYLEERLEKGSVLFLLDGLDEADVGRPSPPWTGGLRGTEATYRHVVGQINVLAARYPNCPMVVTARRENWKGLLAASFQTLEMLGFNRDDIQRFIDNWFGADPRAWDLQSTLSQNPRMWALAANPLFLSLMAFTFEQDGELPEGRVGLYGRGVELWLKSCESYRKDRDPKRIYFLTPEHKRSLLEEVALHFHLRRALLFPEDELREVIANYLPTGLEEISGQHDLLQEQAAGWYGFPHRTWQEYFAAAAISRRGWGKDGEGRIEESLHDSWWEGTVLFLAGVLEDATLLLEGILAQEEDIFYSNLLLAGRCLAVCRPCAFQVEGVGPSTGRCGEPVEPSGQRLWEDITEGLKRLVAGGYHWLLQRQAVSVLAEIGGGAVVSFFVALLRRKDIDLNVRAEVAQVLGALRDQSVVPDLLALLTDEKLDPSVRGNIAEALGALGDESVIPPLLALIPDETVDAAVRGRVVEALGSLGGESVVSPLLAFLPNEGIDPYVRERITEILASLGASRTGGQPFDFPLDGVYPEQSRRAQDRLVLLLPDEKIHPSVRQRVAEAVGSLGDESVVPDLLALLSDEKVDPSVRGKAVEALGALGAESTIPPLLAILGDEEVDYSVRMTVAEVLGVLGDESVASHLLALLSDDKIDPDVRASIAIALGVLGEKSVVPQLLSLLPDEKIDPAVRWRIIDALRSLGDQMIIPHLRALLPNEKIDSSVRWMVTEALEALAGEPTEDRGWRMREWRVENGRVEEALGSLDDRSRVPQFLAFLKDGKIDPSMSGRVIEALGALGDDRATVEGLAALLDREDIGSHVYEALFHVSQRAGLRVFARKGGGYQVRP